MKTISLPFPLTWLQQFDFPRKLGICDLLFGSTITRNEICWVNTAAGVPWKLDLRNPVHRWIVYGKYEGSAFLNWAHKFLPPDGVVVDSGANIGQILLYLAQYLPKGKILAFEPGKEQADWLEECLKVNSTLPVELIRRGLGASTTQLHLSSGGPNFLHGYWSTITETDGELIQVVTLADELAARSIETVNLWKLDVEGYEIPALQGAEELLKKHQIKAIYAELMMENGQKVREFLENFGYTCHLFKPNGKLYIPAQLPIYTNGLFLPS